MSVKGISWIEANFEKLIVVVMLLAFLLVLIFQFVLSSSAVEVGGSKVPLADAFKPAERAAERLQSQINDPNPTLPESIETVDLAAKFEEALSGSVAKADRFLAVADPLALEVAAGDVVFAAAEFAPLVPPAPTQPVAASYRATLDPYAVKEIEGLAAYLPSEQPFDTPWVSVQGSVSGAELRAAYESDPDGPTGVISPLPTNWWSQSVGILAVETERQERDVEGNWGPAVPVTRLPGTMSPLDNLDEVATNYRQLESVGTLAAKNEDVILRPEFFSILEGEAWIPPTEVPDPSEVGDIKSQIRTLERRLAGIDRDIEQKRAALTAQPARGGSDGRDGGEGREGGDESRRRTERPQPQADPNQVDPRVAAIQRQIDALTKRREGVVEELTELGWQPADRTGTSAAYDRSEYAHAEPLLDADEIHFWTHDLDVEPGATYRYRTRLTVVNPMFGRKSSLDPSLHELADAKLTHSPWSEWSEPTSVSWDEYFFLTSASVGETGNIGKTSASAELYRFYYGYWRKSEVTLEPGDRFMAQVKLPEGLQKWDVERPAEEQAWKPVVEGATEPVVQPEGLSESLLPGTLPVSADAWLLDVVSSPAASLGIGGQSRISYEALVRGPDGQISSRSPTADAGEVLLAVVKASAAVGEEQLPRIPGVGPRQRIQGVVDPRDGRFERDDGGVHGGGDGGGGGGG